MRTLEMVAKSFGQSEAMLSAYIKKRAISVKPLVGGFVLTLKNEAVRTEFTAIHNAQMSAMVR